MSGALAGIRVLELGGVGPVPFTGMVLADHGAEVIRLDRIGELDGDRLPARGGPLTRGKRSVGIDLKQPEGVAIARALAQRSDCALEGFRPGVAERLGIGPQTLCAANPALVYARLTGWGQDGDYAKLPGHDINYIALTGLLGAVGRAGEAPVPPVNFVADFGGGGMLAAFGIAAALVERGRSGRGQVLDIAMVDGSALLSTMIHAQRAAGRWIDERGVNVVDSGAPFYDVYETADELHVAVGAGEAPFYAALLNGLGLDSEPDLPDQLDRARWPLLRERFADVFRTRTRAEWCAVFEGTTGCLTPVLSFAEAPHDRHLAQRGTFIDVAGVVQPAPAPRFSRSIADAPTAVAEPGQHTAEVLGELGYTQADLDRLAAAGVVAAGS
jgi:alpha-methylacyl-CoA racemase